MGVCTSTRLSILQASVCSDGNGRTTSLFWEICNTVPTTFTCDGCLLPSMTIAPSCSDIITQIVLPHVRGTLDSNARLILPYCVLYIGDKARLVICSKLSAAVTQFQIAMRHHPGVSAFMPEHMEHTSTPFHFSDLLWLQTSVITRCNATK
jgi:hypothetical protein